MYVTQEERVVIMNSYEEFKKQITARGSCSSNLMLLVTSSYNSPKLANCPFANFEGEQANSLGGVCSNTTAKKTTLLNTADFDGMPRPRPLT